MTFDDYFREGEQKSKEEDYTTSTKGTAPLPPPPKSTKAPAQVENTEPAADTQLEAQEPTILEAEPKPESQDG